MKLRLMRNKATGLFRVLGISGMTKAFVYEKDAIKDYKRLKSNRYAREKNEMLRDLCGTSARAAKLDMGL